MSVLLKFILTGDCYNFVLAVVKLLLSLASCILSHLQCIFLVSDIGPQTTVLVPEKNINVLWYSYLIHNLNVLHHLQCFVQPVVSTVPLAASSMQELEKSTAAIHLIRHWGHRSIQTHCEDAALDSRH